MNVTSESTLGIAGLRMPKIGGGGGISPSGGGSLSARLKARM